MRGCRLALPGALLAAGVLLSGAAVPPQPEPPHHAETIQVREAGVLVEMPPPRLLEKLRRARRPAEFQLLIDGQLHEVVGAEPAGSHDWEIVVYLDPALAPSGPLSDAALLLAKRAERLTTLGSVEIVIADPEPRVALAATRDPALWPAALAQLALTADGRAPGLPEPRLLEVVRRQCDRLTAFAARSRPTRPRALLWIGASDLPVSPTENNALTRATDPGRETVPPSPAPPPIAAAFAGAAETLASYGWVTIPLAVRPPPPPPPPPERPPGSAALERPDYDSALGEGHTFSGFPEDPKAKARRASANLRLDAALLPWLAPQHLLARVTAGRVVQDEIQLDDALDSLGRRWQLWYRPPVAADGRLHRLEVGLDGKVSLNGQVSPRLGLGVNLKVSGDAKVAGNRLPAPVWVRGWER